MAVVLLAVPAAAAAAPELSTSDQLNTRRYVSAGDRAYVMGFQDGRFYAQGWHVTGEMGGVWSQPLKLLDGLWFGVGDDWLGPATTFTSGWGYTRMRFPDAEGLEVSRTDFAPDGLRAVLFGLRLRNPGASAKTVDVKVDVHSEVMSHYPWAWTTPDAGAFNLNDTGSFDDDTLVFHDTGTPHPNAGPHDWVAVVGSTPDPQDGEAGPGHWGPQGPPVLCESEAQFWCDEGPFGEGTGGQLRHEVTVPAGGERTVWVAVAGSDEGAAAARSQLRAALADPDAALAAKQESRERAARYSKVTLPADERLAEGIDWGKQNILDLTQRADRLQVRDVNEGKDYPPPAGTVPHVGWIGAGYPDYPWIFATDAEYTAFAAVAAGQFEGIVEHARALRDVSVILNGDSGKVVHEVVADGSVYFGNLEHAGNTDETAKFPSLVALLWRWTGDNALRRDLYPFAVRNMRYVDHTARRGRRRLAGGPRQRRAPGHGRREARQRGLHDPRALRPGRPGPRRARRQHVRLGAQHRPRPRAALRSDLVARARRASTPTRWSTRTTCSPSSSTGSARRRWRPSSRSTGGRGPVCRRWRTASRRWRAGRTPATPGRARSTSACSTRAARAAPRARANARSSG